MNKQIFAALVLSIVVAYPFLVCAPANSQDNSKFASKQNFVTQSNQTSPSVSGVHSPIYNTAASGVIFGQQWQSGTQQPGSNISGFGFYQPMYDVPANVVNSGQQPYGGTPAQNAARAAAILSAAAQQPTNARRKVLLTEAAKAAALVAAQQQTTAGTNQRTPIRNGVLGSNTVGRTHSGILSRPYGTGVGASANQYPGPITITGTGAGAANQNSGPITITGTGAGSTVSQGK